ncbi:MAG: IPT/TIG domain-containing protein, partial [Spirochaetaceae bacterium]|nr:IPT/TIG domain-containing protein [Spirochaetaceae bacterium]
GESGLVYVVRDDQKSNPMIFLTSSGIPRTVRQTQTEKPVITAIKPASEFAGRTITITGSSFGETRRQKENPALYSSVRFNAAPEIRSLGGAAFGFIEPDENQGAYISWKEREIVLRIPDGAQTGLVSVNTGAGQSTTKPFTVKYQGGTKNASGKHTFAIQYSVDIAIEEAGESAVLYLWMAHPAANAAQRLGEILSYNAEPFLENYHGTMLFRLKDLRNGMKKKLTVERLVEVAALETNIDAAAINTAPAAGFEKIYREESALVPSKNAAVQKAAAAAAGTEKNPYRLARRMYDSLLNNYTIQFDNNQTDPIAALQTKRLGPYTASLLFCALSRACGLAAVPVSGVLIGRSNETSTHHWAQFWLEDFGWVPVDIGFGAGQAPAGWNLRANYREYYFGNIDNQRIAFSQGEINVSKMDIQGRTAAFERMYSMQNIFEEAAGDLEAYSSFWSDVTITGMYQN